MGRTFFRRANLIDGRNAPKKNATVVVEDDRITAVAANGDAPRPSANDVVYDLAGRSLMPGMVQCHYHAAYDNAEKLDDIDLKHPATMLTLIAAKNAELLGMKDDLGTIEAGKLADLLVVNGDPVRDITVLQDRAKLDVIMKGGKFIECQLTPGKAIAKSA
ncbi:MAG TPA: amidohydrolase family protein [Candidatus Binataceae bacterium]|nr:amidohydrolase family protein [Candidatus Binataceae bacterium]